MATLFTKFLSWETKMIVPLYSFNSFSNFSIDSTSKKLVGSSNKSRLFSDTRSLAIAAFTFSQPLKNVIF